VQWLITEKQYRPAAFIQYIILKHRKPEKVKRPLSSARLYMLGSSAWLISSNQLTRVIITYHIRSKRRSIVIVIANGHCCAEGSRSTYMSNSSRFVSNWRTNNLRFKSRNSSVFVFQIGLFQCRTLKGTRWYTFRNINRLIKRVWNLSTKRHNDI
jgi:hypothetical protein